MSNHIHNAIETLEIHIKILNDLIAKQSSESSKQQSNRSLSFLTRWSQKKPPAAERQRDYLQSIVTNLKQGHYDEAMRQLGHIQVDTEDPGALRGHVFTHAGTPGKRFFSANQFSNAEQTRFSEGYESIKSERSKELKKKSKLPKLILTTRNPKYANDLITAYENVAVHTTLLTQGLGMARSRYSQAELGNNPKYKGVLQLRKFTREPLDKARDKPYDTAESYDYGEDHLYPGEDRREKIGSKDQAIRDFKRDVKINGKNFKAQETYDKADEEQKESMIPYDSKDKESKDIKKYILEELCDDDEVLAKYVKDLGGQHIPAFSWNETMTSTHLSDGQTFIPAYVDTKHNVTTTNPIITTEGGSTEDALTVFYDYYYHVYGINMISKDGKKMLRFIKGEEGTLKEIPSKEFERQMALHEEGQASIFDSSGPLFSTHTVFQMKHGEGDTVERKVLHHETRVNVAGLEVRPPVLELREEKAEKRLDQGSPGQGSSSGDFTP